MRRWLRRVAVGALISAAAVLSSGTASAMKCIFITDTHVHDPGGGIPAYCDDGGPGCGYCFDIIIVT